MRLVILFEKVRGRNLFLSKYISDRSQGQNLVEDDLTLTFCNNHMAKQTSNTAHSGIKTFPEVSTATYRKQLPSYPSRRR